MKRYICFLNMILYSSLNNSRIFIYHSLLLSQVSNCSDLLSSLMGYWTRLHQKHEIEIYSTFSGYFYILHSKMSTICSQGIMPGKWLNKESLSFELVMFKFFFSLCGMQFYSPYKDSGFTLIITIELLMHFKSF